jgi:hypothetical protein
MAANRVDNTPDKQKAKAVTKALVKGVGGVETAETFCRPNSRRLSEYGLADTDTFIPLDAIMDLQDCAHHLPDYPPLTRFLATRDGFALVKLPEGGSVTQQSLVGALADASREHSDVANGLLEALRNGAVAPDEAARLQRECIESAEAAMRLHALLGQRAGES